MTSSRRPRPLSRTILMAEALKLARDEKAPYEVRIRALELAISLSGFEFDKKSAKAAKVEKDSSSSRKRLADLLN